MYFNLRGVELTVLRSNPKLNTDCNMLFLGRNFCVGVLLSRFNIRGLVHKQHMRNIRRGKLINQNPGLRKQLELYKTTQPSGERMQRIDENFEDELESDFMSENILGQHKREQQQQAELKHLKNIGRKYFKEKKMPSLLTWGEKEQIKYLHEKDPEEWCVERLAVSFPATEVTIKKVLNSSWKPENSARILKHDANVKKNWDLLKKGKLNVRPDVLAHINKFTSRVDLITSETGITALLDNPQKPRGRIPEFENIIKEYNGVLDKKAKTEDANIESYSSEDIFTPHSKQLLEGKLQGVAKKHVTLDDYKYHISKSEVNDDQGTEVIHLESTSVMNFQATNNGVKKSTSNRNKLERINDSVMEKIKIPKNKWQKGVTYRIKDCYYDDDGRFLYRVPGMTQG